MTVSHTPTPWKLYPHLFGQIESQDETKLITRAGRVDPVTDLDQCERAANAEFIVRACNSHDQLVAALKAVVEFYSYAEYGPIAQARAALAAAGAA